MMINPQFSIIIVTYKSHKVISSCLSSIFKSALKNVEIIIVDNSPDNKTKSIIQKKFNSPLLKIISTNSNLGYAAGNNLGVRHSKGKWILILNPDCQVKSDWLSHTKIAVKKYPHNLIQPLIIDPQTNKVSIAGKIRNYLGFDYIIGSQTNISDWTQPSSIFSISGSAIIIPKHLFIKLNGFDTRFFMYYEDSDLAWRAKLMKINIILFPSIHIYHEYFFYTKDNEYLHQQKKWFLLERNRLLMILKNYSLKTLFILTPIIIISEIGLVIYSLKHRFFISKIKGYLSLILSLPQTLINRSIVNRSRLIPDRLTLGFMSATIEIKCLDSAFTKIIVNPILNLYYQYLFKPLINVQIFKK